MIEINGENTTTTVQGSEDMFDESFFEQVEEIVDHEAFQNDIVIQPDGHYGAGAVIGFTMPLGDRVTPNVVGSDIGCGITAVNIGQREELESNTSNEEYWEDVDEQIRSEVPMGLGQLRLDPDYHMIEDFPWERCQELRDNFDFDREVEYGKEYLMDLCERVHLDVNEVISSMGTLGSGNHFFEISQSEENGDFWLVVHSGSRCVGGAVAGYWQDKATESVQSEEIVESMEEWMWDYVKFDEESPILNWVLGGEGEAFYDMDKIREDFDGEEIEERRRELTDLIPDENRNDELDYLVYEDKEQYITDMIFAQQYARENRRVMLDDVCDLFGWEYEEMIDSIHNYIDFEDKIIRKGATRAREDEKLIIPFNMAEGAVICRGKGNVEFNYSAPHGAGRRGSRTWAYNEFDTNDFEEQMEGIHNMNDTEEVLDEIPSAYKDSEEVIEHMSDTVEIEYSLTPILNMKGE